MLWLPFDASILEFFKRWVNDNVTNCKAFADFNSNQVCSQIKVKIKVRLLKHVLCKYSLEVQWQKFEKKLFVLY